MDEVVIGEAVVLEADAVAVGTRIIEGLIDVVALIAFATALGWGLSAIDTGGYDGAALIGMLVLVYVVVPTTVETLTRGRSLGKLAMGTRVVRDDGGAIRFRHALTRALLGVLEIWMTLGVVAVVTSMVNRKGKRLGDIVAGTYVVRVRGARGIPPLPPVDPSLRAWSHGADVARLPDGLAVAVRLFLARAPRMDPQSRVRLGVDLAGRVEAYVAPAAPWGTPPEAFLVAVMSERRDRDWALGVRDQARADADDLAVRRLPLGVSDPAV
ncbi:RDD family protein [Luteimicrobium subarcticum]|uniref:Putative RDD family membrane protein YckC n=1 Tax=Luteimicrobium subarcticum TaxID=620910 RepID=A0A2M8WTQ6_9MICO|nr:RDD family protein [Luteimicrobium subarcticum]PJI94279.1 putative RDD family membrane protein YckC [Luteimicrobium subarcticum]